MKGRGSENAANSSSLRDPGVAIGGRPISSVGLTKVAAEVIWDSDAGSFERIALGVTVGGIDKPRLDSRRRNASEIQLPWQYCGSIYASAPAAQAMT